MFPLCTNIKYVSDKDKLQLSLFEMLIKFSRAMGSLIYVPKEAWHTNLARPIAALISSNIEHNHFVVYLFMNDTKQLFWWRSAFFLSLGICSWKCFAFTAATLACWCLNHKIIVATKCYCMMIRDMRVTVELLKLLQKESSAHFLTYSLNHMHVDAAKCQQQYLFFNQRHKAV